MTRRERLAWWVVCIVPKFLARWLMWGSGQRIKLPGSWVPYLFGRALGVDGSRCRIAPTLAPGEPEPQRAKRDSFAA